MSTLNQPGATVYDSAHQSFTAFAAQLATLDRYVLERASRWPAARVSEWTAFRDSAQRFLELPQTDMNAARRTLQAYIDTIPTLRASWPRDPARVTPTHLEVDGPQVVSAGVSPWVWVAGLGVVGLAFYFLRKRK